MPVERAFDGNAELVLDDRLSPILIATWFGSASAKTLDAFQAWVDEQIVRARARGEHLALINDSSDAEPLELGEREFDNDVLVTVGWATSCSTLPDAFDQARTALREVGDRPPPPARINAYLRAQREPVPGVDRR
jgi:hypothetical protein